MSDVGLDERLEVSGVSEGSSPVLKSSDVLLDSSAVGHQSGKRLNDTKELFDASDPLFVPKILKGVVSRGGLSLTFTEASLDLSEVLLLDDTMNDTGKHGIVLVSGQVTDWLCVEKLHASHELFHLLLHENGVHLSSLFSYLIIMIKP